MRLWMLLACCVSAQDAEEIVRRSIERDSNNIERMRNYTFLQRVEERTRDAQGRVTKTESDTEEILILGGRPYSKKVAHNDQPLSERDARREQQKLDKEAARRQNESPKDKAKLEKERSEARRFLREIPEAYTLRLLGSEEVSGKPAWVIEAIPKPGYRPKLKDARLLTKVRGKLWIDRGEYQWVKAEADVTETLSFGLGLLRIAPGSALRLEQTRVNDEVWLPKQISIRGDARLGYIKKLRADVSIDYRDYRKFQSESRLLDGEPVEAR